MITTHKIDVYAPLSEKDEKLLQEAMQEDVVYDEDCPPLTDKEIEMFRQVEARRKANRKKQTVSIRLSPTAMKKARSIGKGYTSVLSRMIEAALADNNTIKHYL